jgi:hypothetical protein
MNLSEQLTAYAKACARDGRMSPAEQSAYALSVLECYRAGWAAARS